MRNLINEIRATILELRSVFVALKWSWVILGVLIVLHFVGQSFLISESILFSEIDSKELLISDLEDRIENYYEPQDASFRTTLERVTEYITQTDMYLNVGGYDVRPEYYDPISFEVIGNRENIDFFELLTTTELFFSARAEYFDTIPNIWPLRYSRRMRITSPFGPRFSPFTGDMQQHEGIDIVSTYRAEILATAPGVIEEHWIYHPVLGKYIIINHDDRYRTHYAHLSESYIRERMVVERGQVLGRVGNTGLSAGAHIHYAIEVRDEETGEWVFVDPQAFLLRAVGDETAPVITQPPVTTDVGVSGN